MGCVAGPQAGCRHPRRQEGVPPLPPPQQVDHPRPRPQHLLPGPALRHSRQGEFPGDGWRRAGEPCAAAAAPAAARRKTRLGRWCSSRLGQRRPTQSLGRCSAAPAGRRTPPPPRPPPHRRRRRPRGAPRRRSPSAPASPLFGSSSPVRASPRRSRTTGGAPGRPANPSGQPAARLATGAVGSARRDPPPAWRSAGLGQTPHWPGATWP
mmetsp:Transcript_77178/g.243837  ORF Transcript_77178/g.243837 Transcript_77178/m.243837 type:complete len:209 (+) Transcript_77178:1050-1676(+)